MTVSDNMRIDMEQVLVRLGILPHQIGYTYILKGLVLCLENSDHLRRITAGLYAAISAQSGASISAVERGIRGAIERAWTARVYNEMGDLFAAWVSRPNNGQFFAVLSSYLRFRWHGRGMN